MKTNLSLNELIFEAATELGSAACDAGKHDWVFEGGRHCPKDYTDDCSQSVYRCKQCGRYDYAGDGGPGDADCADFCQHRTTNDADEPQAGI